MQEKIQEREGGELDYRDIYTPLSVAKEEIWRRWNDKELRKKVEDFLGGDVPDFLKKSPRAFLARYVASPNFEMVLFNELSSLINLKPICLEYPRDIFAPEDIDKYYLGKIYLHNGMGGKGGDRLKALRIIDFNKSDGKNICDIKTSWNENFVEFHHRLMNSCGLNLSVSYFDFSRFLERNGAVARRYYKYFFSMLICYGVLFENYLLDEKQISFTKGVILPNYKKVFNMFGLKPLIVRLCPVEDEENLYWRYYPSLLTKKLFMKGPDKPRLQTSNFLCKPNLIETLNS